VPNPDCLPRSHIVAATRDDDAAQVGDNGEDMAITAFPALAPIGRLPRQLQAQHPEVRRLLRP
jgi:hypothetical protein